MINKIFIDIPFTELKKAVKEAEKKQGICKILPHGRFLFSFVRDCGLNVRRIEEEDGQKITFDLLVCEALGGNSTGTSADHCRNCVIDACKHEHTKREKCDEPECSHFGKFHTLCLDCGVMVDLLNERKQMQKKLQKMNKQWEKKKLELST